MDRKKVFLFIWVACLLFHTLYAESTAPQLTLLGKWGSNPYQDVAVHGNYAYCLTQYSGLDVLYISDPSNPVRTGDCRILGESRHICHSEDHVYVSINDYWTNEGGLQVIDITDPYAPLPVGYIDLGSTLDVDVAGQYAYTVTQDTGLVIIDISVPTAPVEVGTYYNPDMVSRVAVSGNHAYLLNRSSLRIVDISNPRAPSLAGEYPTTYNAYDVLDIVISGEYAYTAGVHFGLRIFDISNPAEPVVVGTHDQGMTYGVAIDGNLAYLYGDYSFKILDIANRSMPVLLAEFDTRSPGITGLDISPDGNYLFAANPEEGLIVYDVRNPVSPTPAGSYADITTGISDMTARGQYAYLAEASGLFIVDMTNPTCPTLEGKFRTTYIGTNNIEVDGDYAYITDYSGLKIIRIAVPSLPEEIGRYSSRRVYEHYELHGIKIRGNYAYTTRTNYSFLVIDISNPGDPQLAGSNSSVEHGNFALRDQYAYVAARNRNTLDIVDVSIPGNPTRAGVLQNMSWSEDIILNQNYAYLTCGNGLAIVDITTPASPLKIGNIDFTTYARGLFIKNNRLYVSVPGVGIRVFDITVPSSPQPAFTYEVTGGANDIHIDGNYLYVRNNRLYVYWIGDIPVWVTSPGATDTLPLGSSYTITWEPNTRIQTTDGSVDIELYRGSIKVGTIAENIPLPDGNYTWTVGMFNDGGRFLKPGKLYQVGIRTAENNYLALSDRYFTVPSTGVTVSLQVERKEEKAWLIKRFYGQLDIRVEKETNAAAVEKYVIKRKENDGQYRVVGEFRDEELNGNAYTYLDTFIFESMWYHYYIEAVTAAGVVVAASDTKTLYPTNGTILGKKI